MCLPFQLEQNKTGKALPVMLCSLAGVPARSFHNALRVKRFGGRLCGFRKLNLTVTVNCLPRVLLFASRARLFALSNASAFRSAFALSENHSFLKQCSLTGYSIAY